MKKIMRLFSCQIVMIMLITTVYACTNSKNVEKDDFGDAVMELVKLSGQAEDFEEAKGKMIPAMMEYNKALLAPESADRGDALAQQFLDENFEDEIMKPVFVSMFKGKITTEEIKEIIEKLQTEEGRRHNEHFSAINKKLPEIMANIGEVDPSNPAKTEYTCPDEYAQKFAQYYKGGFLAKSMDSAIDMIKGLAALNPEANGEQMQAIESLIKFMEENFPIQMANAAYGTLTDEDLDFGIGLNKMPAYRKYVDSFDMKEIVTAAAQLGTSIGDTYKEWLSKQNVKLK